MLENQPLRLHRTGTASGALAFPQPACPPPAHPFCLDVTRPLPILISSAAAGCVAVAWR